MCCRKCPMQLCVTILVQRCRFRLFAIASQICTIYPQTNAPQSTPKSTSMVVWCVAWCMGGLWSKKSCTHHCHMMFRIVVDILPPKPVRVKMVFQIMLRTSCGFCWPSWTYTGTHCHTTWCAWSWLDSTCMPSALLDCCMEEGYHHTPLQRVVQNYRHAYMNWPRWWHTSRGPQYIFCSFD